MIEQSARMKEILANPLKGSAGEPIWFFVKVRPANPASDRPSWLSVIASSRADALSATVKAGYVPLQLPLRAELFPDGFPLDTDFV